MTKNKQALFDALQLYAALHDTNCEICAAHAYPPADMTALGNATTIAYTDLMAAVAVFIANPEK